MQNKESILKYVDAETLPEHLSPLLDKVFSNLTEHQSKMLKSVVIQYSDVFIEPDGSLGRAQT